jgi:hypothetical protein
MRTSDRSPAAMAERRKEKNIRSTLSAIRRKKIVTGWETIQKILAKTNMGVLGSC